MRKFIYLFTSFVALALFMVQSSFAADPNDYRQPNTWQRERTINDAVNKSSVTVEASKTYPVSTLDQNGKPIKQMRKANATIKIKPNANKIGKTLMKRAPYTAIAYAVTSLLGRAVDWVLDPANNRVKYKEFGGDFKDGLAYRAGPDANGKYPTKQAACASGLRFLPKDATWSFDHVSSDGQNCIGTKTKDGKSDSNLTLYTVQEVKYDPPSEQDQDWRYISADELGAEVIKNAEDGKGPAIQVMSDSALDSLNSGGLDSALDAASDIPQPDPQEITQAQYDNPDYPTTGTGTGTETPTDPENPTDSNEDPKPSEWPPFCDWAFKVCDFIDWVQTEPIDPDESGDIEVEKPDPDMHVGILERLYIDMPAACPADPILEFMGAKIPFPMSIFCQFAEMMKPLILLFAYIKGLSIIGNGLT